MSLSRRQQRLLTGIDAVRSPDPRTASMLAAFGRIAAGQPMPRREELRGPASRIRAVLLAAASAVRSTLHQAGAACAVPSPIPGGTCGITLNVGRGHPRRRVDG